MSNNESRCRLYTLHNNNHHEIGHRSKFKCKTVKLPEDNIGKNLNDLECSNNFLNKTQEAWSMKEKISKLELIKI